MQVALCLFPVVLFLVLNPSVNAQDPPNDFSPSLSASLQQQDPATESRSALERAVRQNPSPELLFALATTLLADGDFTGRRRAMALLKHASQIEPAYLEARLLLARLFERSARRSAFSEYRDILEVAPACATAWYRLGRLLEADFYEWRHASSRVLTPQHFVSEQSDMQVPANTPEHRMHFLAQGDATGMKETTWIPLMESSDDDYEDAAEAFENCIAYDSTMHDAYYRLALLQLETQRHGRALPLLEQASVRFPRDVDLHLLLAICQYRTHDNTAASATFERSFALMPRRAREAYLFSSTSELLAPRFSDELAGIGTEERQEIFANFWAVTDPLFLTEENEALLEHYTRMALANVLFSLPVAGIQGWKTDRGKALLRFGMPHSRVRLRPGIEVGSVMHLSSKTELWYYPDFVLGFTDEFNCGNYRFSVPDEGDNAQYDGNARQLYEDLSRTAFYHGTSSFRGTVLAVPATVFRFRSMESSIPGDLEVAIAYTMPLLGSMDQNADAAHTFGVFLLDDEGRRLYEKREQIGAREKDAGLIRESASGPALLRCPTFYSSPDSGILSLEWIRTADGAAGVMRKRIRLEALDEHPELSDIVFATTIAPDAPHLPLQRGSLGIAPYPWAHFGPSSTPSIYFEVYDLGVDEEGRSDFDLFVTLRSRDEDDGIFDSFESLLQGLGLMENPELTTTTGYMSEGPMAQLYMQIDFSAYTPGAYELSVRIVDHIRKKEIERRVPVDLVSER